jgi:hypothetical protein
MTSRGLDGGEGETSRILYAGDLPSSVRWLRDGRSVEPWGWFGG